LFKVMIVDDMEVLRRDVKRLKLWGEYSGFIITEEAKDGQEALKKLEANLIDLVITDIKMPNMDGIELLQNISEKQLCPFIVLLSDYTEYNYARQGFLYGAFDYLAKPVEEKELAKLLVRIKNQLNEKLQQEQKLQALQGIAEEALFIADNTKQVIVLIQTGDPKAASFSSNLIDKIGLYFNSGRLETLLALQNAMHEIIGETLQAHEWIERFLDVDALKTVDYSSCKNQEEMKALAMDILEKLITVINRLIGCHNSKIVKQACEYTLKNIDEGISVKILSEKLFVNKSHLSEIFKQEFGVTVLEYITMVKMERAKKLLQEGNLKNYQIAEILGFQDSEYFGRLFRKYTGVLPKNYRI
jgi:two-component system, response regulator YesN